MAAATQHPYQRNDYQGTDLIQKHLAKLDTPKNNYPLMDETQFKSFCAMRVACSKYLDPRKGERVLKDSMQHFRRTGNLLLIIEPD